MVEGVGAKSRSSRRHGSRHQMVEIVEVARSGQILGGVDGGAGRFGCESQRRVEDKSWFGGLQDWKGEMGRLQEEPVWWEEDQKLLGP